MLPIFKIFGNEYFFTDTEAPTIISNCPSDQTIIGQSFAEVNWTKPEATDNSGQEPTVTCSTESGSQFGSGTTTVTCQAIDSAKNHATCSFTVQIKGIEIDDKQQNHSVNIS